MLGLILTILIVGAIAGFLARLLVPGRQDMSVVATIVLGIVGSFVGGFLGYLLFRKDSDDGFLQPAGIIGSIIGAVIALLVWMAVQRRSARPRLSATTARGWRRVAARGRRRPYCEPLGRRGRGSSAPSAAARSTLLTDWAVPGRFEIVARRRPVSLVAPGFVAVREDGPGRWALPQPAPYAAATAVGAREVALTSGEVGAGRRAGRRRDRPAGHRGRPDHPAPQPPVRPAPGGARGARRSR